MKLKNFRNIIIGILIFVMILGRTQVVYAGSASVSVTPSASSVTTGTTVTVTIGISADEAVGYGVAISYNPSVLEYQGGGDGGGGGTVTIINEGDGATSSFSRTLTFKAIGTGSTTIGTSAFAGGLFGYSTGDMAVSYGSATVTVSAPQAPSGGGNGGNSGNNGGNGEAPLTGSDDNYLKSLEISPGTLSPSFQSGTMSYSVNLPEDTTSIVVSAIPRDSKAKVSVSHNNDLEPGANKTYIVVTAENGTQRTYVLNINCGDVEDETEAPPLTIDGAEYTFATAEQMEGVAIPEGFQATEEMYQEQTIMVYTSPNQLIQIAYLLDAEENGRWFIYDKNTSVFTPFVEFRANVNSYIILTPNETVVIPVGYEPSEVDIQGQKVVGYRKAGMEAFVLVYAMNLQGEAGFYLYDEKEGTYQRYVEPEVVEEPTTTEEVLPEPVVVTEDEKVKNLQVILYVLSGVCVAMLGGLIGMVLYNRKKR